MDKQEVEKRLQWYNSLQNTVILPINRKEFRNLVLEICLKWLQQSISNHSIFPFG